MAVIHIQGEEERKRGIHYEVDTDIAPIGCGGMGNVMRGNCIDENTGSTRQVAIKFVYDDLPPQTIERARREGSVCLKNDNLIEMLGFIETKTQDHDGNFVSHYHIVSELLHGVTLRELLEGKCTDKDGQTIGFALEMSELRNKDSVAFAREICKRLLNGLLALHAAGIIHRDIDPSNIMLTDDRKVKLIDFGISRRIDEKQGSSLTVAGKFMGKAEYASPELALGDVAHQNKTTDLYAVGVLLYELIIGKRPFEGALNDVLQHQIKDKMPLGNIKDTGIRKIIKRATEKKQLDRYQSAAEFLVALEHYTPTTEPGWIRFIKEKKLLVASAACAVVLCIVVGFLIPSGKQTAEVPIVDPNDSIVSVAANLVNTASKNKVLADQHRDDYDASLDTYIEAMRGYKKVSSLCNELTDMKRKKDIPEFAKDKSEVEQELCEAYKAYKSKYDFFNELGDSSAAKEFTDKMDKIKSVIDVEKLLK